MDSGFRQAIGIQIKNPLPVSWLNLAAAPPSVPSNSNFNRLSSVQIRNLQSQIAYDLSAWDYNKIGPNNELGRYQFSSTLLEDYSLLIPGSNKQFGNNCVNRQICWNASPLTTKLKSGYRYNISSLQNFLISTAGQEHLAYQYLNDLYEALSKTNAITPDDTADTVAGMIYVGWALGVDGAYTWRYNGIGEGANSYNSGRYAITVLSQ